MRGLDTNVLARFLTRDEPRQTAAARQLLEGAEERGETLRITLVVLCELVWTLRGGQYRYDRHTIAAVLQRLLETPLFEIEKRETVRLALEAYRDGRADFADYVIGRENASAGCRDTVTFDRSLGGEAGFSLLEA